LETLITLKLVYIPPYDALLPSTSNLVKVNAAVEKGKI
jgi:hypothetical protein